MATFTLSTSFDLWVSQAMLTMYEIENENQTFWPLPNLWAGYATASL